LHETQYICQQYHIHLGHRLVSFVFRKNWVQTCGGAPAARATATGMAAVTAVFLAGLKTGDHVVSANALFGSCRYVMENVLPRFGITTSFVNGSDLDAWQAAIKPTTRLLFLETPSNPTLQIVDMAAVAKIADKPLFRLLAERHGREANRRVFVYAAGGYYYPGKDLAMLRAEMRRYLDRGYTVVKMKIGGDSLAQDAKRIEAVLSEIGSDAQLAVDANGRFDLETAIAYAKMLRDYPLFWYEEAGDPLDYALQAALAEFYPGAMATGENLFSHQDAREEDQQQDLGELCRLNAEARQPNPDFRAIGFRQAGRQ
jgi:hypothetical protein